MRKRKANKRTKQERLAGRARIAELYLEGTRQVEIAKILTNETGIIYSLDMVKVDVSKIRKDWLESSIRDFDQLKSEQLAKLDVLERNAWDQWHRSCESSKKVTIEDKKDSAFPGVNTKTETISEVGDPRYLNTILSIIERRCKILSLDGPLQVISPSVEGKNGGGVGSITSLLSLEDSIEKWRASLDPADDV